MKNDKKFWNREAEKFSRSGNEESKNLYQRSKIYLKSEDKLLDFACGTGQSTLLFSNDVKEAIGLDYSEEMIKYALVNNRTNVSFIHGTIHHEVMKENSFDVVLAFNVLHLIKDLEGTTRKIMDTIRPGGYFITYTPCISNEKSLYVKLIKFMGQLNLFPQVYPFTSDELLEKLLHQDFSIVEKDIERKKISNMFLVLRKEK